MKSSVHKKLDQELVEWIDLASDDSRQVDDSREVIVEAKVPKRLVRPVGRRGIEFTGGADAASASERSVVLIKLQAYITELIGTQPNVLFSSAAIPLIATRQQLQKIASRPDVKAVRVNRRLTH